MRQPFAARLPAALSALLAAWLFMAFAACAQQPGVHRATAETHRIELTRNAGFLADRSATLTAPEVEAMDRAGAMTHPAVPHISMWRIDHGEAFWLKLDVAADASAAREWVLELGRPNVDRVQLFIRQPDGQWQPQPEVGAARPFAARALDHRGFSYPVQLQPGAVNTFLVRIVYAGPSTPKAVLWQPAAFHAENREVLKLGGLYFGLALGMLLYNLLLFVSVKDRGFLLYAGCVVCTGVAYGGSSGIGAQFIWGDLGPWTSHVMYASYGFALAFSCGLTRQFLKTRERLPAADKPLRAVAWGSLAAGVWAAVAPSNLALMALAPLGLVCSLLIPGVAVVGLLKGWPGARFFCAAWGSLYVGVLVVIARTFQIIPYTPLVENSLAISSAVEMILLSLALADRINDEKRQKEQAQTLAVGVLKASQAITSETRLERLHARLCDIVVNITGAASVRFVLRDPDLDRWYLYDENSENRRVDLTDAQRAGRIPLAALQTAHNAREPVRADDGSLVLPIVHHASVTAMLLLEKRDAGDDFRAQTLAALETIAGPIAVSLENVLLYERLEQHVAERTRELRMTQQELVVAARRAGMAEVAANVLHNVGNTLNSVNVAAEMMGGRLARSKAADLSRAVDLLEAHRDDLAGFFMENAKGRLLPQYLRELSSVLEAEHEELKSNLRNVTSSIDHIKRVVATQQAHAGSSVLLEDVDPANLIEEALRLASARDGRAAQVVKAIDDVPAVRLDKTRTLQVIVNLVDNAQRAMEQIEPGQRRLTLKVDTLEGTLRFTVADTGCGIPREDLARIFSHGYSTRGSSHGFGLHSGALAAADMGGRLTAQSDGPGQGAVFRLELPFVVAQAEAIAG